MALPPFQIDTSISLAAGLYEALRGAILRGELKAGEKLTEVSLAEHVQISRTPVREALRHLQLDGLLESAGRSLIVAPVNLDAMMEMCVVRETLEGLAARLAASYRGEADLLALADLQETMCAASAVNDVAAVVRANHRFHATIWHASRNRYLARQLQDLRQAIERLQTSTLNSSQRRAEAEQEHEEILAALQAGDMEWAERATRQHFRNAELLRLRLLRLKADTSF
ncbi:GntR family transcriptional regulator [Deinococcus deserti]|uniref:Putative transcriptional regulator, GntR n=2 Tax=Deinococcus TaxID=1298 RepID=C1D492_DEIDV|nr:putative transcriptional regulator, GntR [Deinococcus deserti VCD115]